MAIIRRRKAEEQESSQTQEVQAENVNSEEQENSGSVETPEEKPKTRKRRVVKKVQAEEESQKPAAESDENTVFYIAENDNKLRYDDAIDCVWPQKMKISILLFQYEDNWVLYGIGGVNAPRIPFFTQRIQTSFINRIKTFCSFIFQKL